MTSRMNMKSTAILQLLKTGASYLGSCGVDDPRAEADILLAYALDTTRDKLYTDINAAVADDRKNKFTELLQRRGSREPLAYLLKNRNFMGFDFYVDERVLIPRPETELLVQKVVDIAKNKKSSPTKILDLCTGSGILAITIAYYLPGSSIVAVDISEGALAVARINAERLQVSVDFRQGDLLLPVKGEKFDIIVSNPPYVSEQEYEACSPEVKKEPTLALLAGEDGLDFYRRVSKEIQQHLLPGGTVLMEIGWNQAPEVIELFREKGYTCTRFSDLAGLDRIIIIVEEE